MIERVPQPRHRPVIRVFVSSTFTDLKHERDALQQKVFPELERLCATRQFQFQAIDLRWGVTWEQAPLNETLRHRLAEIERCRPQSIDLLGGGSEETPLRLERNAKVNGDSGWNRKWEARKALVHWRLIRAHDEVPLTQFASQ